MKPQVGSQNIIFKDSHLIAHVDDKSMELTLSDGHSGQRLMIVPGLAMLRPVLDAKTQDFQCHKICQQGETTLFSFHGGGLQEYEVRLQRVDDHLEICSRFTVQTDCELNRLELFPAGTGLNLYDVVNFRNRHFSQQTWPELNLGGKGCETDTYSGDWQFAPHPTMFLFRKGDAHLFWGVMDLPKSFGMYLKVADYRVQHWYLDYGAAGFGQKLKAGETFESPRFCLFLDRGQSVQETIRRWCDLLVQQNLIPDPASKERFAWHTDDMYCTWHDQVIDAKTIIAAELSEQASGAAKASAMLTESFVRKALAVIRSERLPFRTIILDEGWEVARGQWDVHTQRFPDLRKLVDDIHAMGLKVIVWWNWADLYDDAQANPDHLIGGGKRNRHGQRMRDYSNPRTQREYLEPLFHHLFSSDPGCCDLDGVKTDFQADKVHADMPLYDPSWRGEENYFHQVHRLFYEMLRRFKSDACHLGCAGHPFLAQYIDINRTYDVFSSNWREPEARAKMLLATTPGCPVSFDLHNYLEHLEEWFASARQLEAAVQIGNIFHVYDDVFSPSRPADAEYYATLRRLLKGTK